MKQISGMFAWILAGVMIAAAAPENRPQEKAAGQDGQGYRIDQPGTITFTVGVKIKGKVEKPQVMIMLPKEKSIYREVEFSRSFKEDIMEPLPLIPVTK